MQTMTKEVTVVNQTSASPSLNLILPHYLNNHAEQRSASHSSILQKTSVPYTPEERRPETRNLPLRGIDYSQTDLAVNKLFANTHRCPPGDNMCDLCKKYFAKRQPNGYEAFINHIFLRMRSDLKQHAKRYIIHKPHPHLPMFVFSKFLHPKIFTREIRKPRERTHQEFHGNSRPPKALRYQRKTSRTAFNRLQNSPATTLNSTGNFEGINLQSLDDKNTNSTRRKSVGRLKHRKKKHRLRSSKQKKESEGKENDEESQTEDDGNEFTNENADENQQNGVSAGRRGNVKKERKLRDLQRKRNQGNKEYHDSEEDGSNISKNDTNEKEDEIKIEMKPPPLPRYQSKPPPLATRSTNRQKMAMRPKQQPNNNGATNKPQTKNIVSFFGQMNTASDVNNNEIQSWLQEQLEFSFRACRFELPIDGRVLQDMAPEDYLRRYCVVTPQFRSVYQNIFRKYQRPQMMRIHFKDLETALRDVTVNNFNREKMEMIHAMTGINEESIIDYKLFCGIAALAERVGHDKTERWETSDDCEEKRISRDILETADFSALDWKLQNVEICDQMKHILWTISS